MNKKNIDVGNEELTATIQKFVQTNLLLEQQVKEKKIAELDAKTNLAILNTIMENFPNGVIMVFNDKFQVEYSEGEEIHTEILKEFALHKGVYVDGVTGMSQEREENLKEHIQRTLDGEHLSYEIPLNGQTYKVNTAPLPRTYSMGKRALLVYQNITADKKIEAERENALQKARELNELKSRFIAMASHEFRTPLSTINLSTALIEKLNAPGNEEKRLNYLEKIKSNVKNLVVILDDFLNLSKLEEGKTTVHSEIFDLLSFSENIIESFEETKKIGQTISLKASQERLNVVLDKKLMYHILLNLVSNAIKYTPEHKSIVLNISEVKNKLRIEVIDQGIGIPKSEQAYLFQRFFRANNTKNIQGTGLGLTIIKQYTELMDGTIRFTSQLNQGTTFTLEFPKTVIQ